MGDRADSAAAQSRHEPRPLYLSSSSRQRLGHNAAIAAALSLRGEVTYKKASRILKKQGLYLPRKEFYNLERQSEKGELTGTQELTLLLEYLEQDDFRVRILEDYITEEDGKPKDRVIKAIAFANSEMIRLARLFVSGFVYMIDVTFGTNKRRLPLLTCVGIDNTDETFPFLLAYIVSESAETFRFMNNMLTELVFYNIPSAAVCIGDFAGGLQSAMSDLNEQEATAAAADGREAELCQLQLCIWHAVEAIRAKLVRTGKYSKQKREELTDLIWKWAQSNTLVALDENRNKLLAKLGDKEQQYLHEYYKPKENQFTKVYAKTYRNLGYNSTQRAEGYHTVLKAVCDRTKPLSSAVRGLRDHCEELARQHDARINRDRAKLPRLFDRSAFRKVLGRITHFALEAVSREWEAVKEIAEKARRDEEGGREAFAELKAEAEGGEGDICVCQCEIKVRFSLPCRHLMWPRHRDKEPLTAELFHPRWFLDHQTDQNDDQKEERSDGEEKGRWNDDRYRDKGAAATYFYAQKLADFQASLKGPYAE